jgi:hypothetical protein
MQEAHGPAITPHMPVDLPENSCLTAEDAKIYDAAAED